MFYDTGNEYNWYKCVQCFSFTLIYLYENNMFADILNPPCIDSICTQYVAIKMKLL